MNWTQPAMTIMLGMLGIAIVLAFYRLVRGPSLPDRVVALDLLATIGIGIITIHAIITNQTAFLDVAVTLALIAFLGTVAFAFYLKRRGES